MAHLTIKIGLAWFARIFDGKFPRWTPMTWNQIKYFARRKLRPPFRPIPERDVLLVSYPRSGNTWVRTIIAGLQLKSHVGSLRELDFVVPDSHFEVAARDMQRLPFYVVKSHFPLIFGAPSADFRKVIYLVRDPRDVALSFYRFMTKRKDYSGPETQFIKDMFSGRVWPCSWQEHVLSWTACLEKDRTREMLVLRYEEICRAPEKIVQIIDDFLGLNSEEQWIRDVVRCTSITDMRTREVVGNRPQMEIGEEYLIGQGIARGWVERLETAEVQQIRTLAGSAMLQHGYG